MNGYEKWIGIALSGLAENVKNHADIVGEDFIKQLTILIEYNDEDVSEKGIMLALILFEFGTDETQQKVKEAVIQRRIRELISSDEGNIAKIALFF
ncbi:MAG: hypothetical protein EZS28_034190 [Streblomastix strix]|uniref:Uncharacterized protein n=1 Tax=Streblomastix strix TaxID=222440 RepID=A0A5J4UJN7_9EUKA|nr:MAG: hypothetical protein EZS28_034190 [Streblomastix strix]